MANLIKSIWNGASNIVEATATGLVDGVNTCANTLHVTAQTTGIAADLADELRNGKTPLSQLMADAIVSEFNNNDSVEEQIAKEHAKQRSRRAITTETAV